MLKPHSGDSMYARRSSGSVLNRAWARWRAAAMAAALVTGAPSDGWNFSVQLSEALGSSIVEGMVMAFFRRPVS